MKFSGCFVVDDDRLVYLFVVCLFVSLLLFFCSDFNFIHALSYISQDSVQLGQKVPNGCLARSEFVSLSDKRNPEMDGDSAPSHLLTRHLQPPGFNFGLMCCLVQADRKGRPAEKGQGEQNGS